MAQSIDKLLFVLEANTKGLRKGFDFAVVKAKAASGKIGRSIKSIGIALDKTARRAAKFGLAMAAAGAIMLGVMVNSSLQSIDAQAKVADKIGITTEKLAGLQHIAELSGGSIKGMNEALTKASKRLGEASTGGGAAAKWLNELNLDVSELQKLSPDELFNEYSDAIGGLNDRGQQLAAISALMGDESRSLIGVIDGGSDAINAATEEVTAYGVAISRVDAAKIEMANDSFTRTGAVLDGVGNTITIALAPYLDDLATRFTTAGKESNGFRDAVGSGMDFVLTAVAKVSDTFMGLEIVWSVLKKGWWDFVGVILNGVDSVGTGVAEFASWFNIDIKPNASIQEWLATAKTGAQEAQLEFSNLMAQIETGGAPSTKMAEYLDEVKRKSQETAEQIVADKQKMSGTGGGAGGAESDDSTLASAKKKADDLSQITTDIENEMIQSMISGNEATAYYWDERIAGIQEKQALDLENKTEYDQQIVMLEEMKYQEMQLLQKTYEENAVSNMQGFFQTSMGLAKGQNKAIFGIMKGGALAMAGVNMHTAISNALATPPSPNIPLALLAGAKGAAEISSIAGVGFRRGGGNVESGSPYVVGESGAELFTPDSNGTITPNHMMGKGGGGGRNITLAPVINFNFTSYDSEDVAAFIDKNKDTLANAVTESMRDNLMEFAA